MHRLDERKTRREFLTITVAAAGVGDPGRLRRVGVDAVGKPAAETECTANQKVINRVKLMPNLPEPYELRDWKRVAQDYDAFVFDFNAKGEFLPVTAWDDHPANYGRKSFSMVSYVGYDPRETKGEAINNLAAVVGATLAGIDKSNQNGHNFVAMCQKWFSEKGSEDIYLNGPGTWAGPSEGGEDFGYMLLPNVLFFALNYLYPGTGDMPKQFVRVAERYYDACVGMGGRTRPWTIPNFAHTTFSFQQMKPVDQGSGPEPESAAAIAWLEYMAWVQTGKFKYLNAADWGMQFLEHLDYNPYGDILLPFGAYLAARMNAELDRQYDVEKLLNWCFDGNSRYRQGWGVLAERAGDFGLDGLVGSITDGEGYGFAMETFEQAGALVPLVRYDSGYAHDVGKWMLNLANSARLFYANALDAEHQSCFEWEKTYDKRAVLSYEGIRRWKRGAEQALSDYRTVHGRIVAGNFASTHYLQEIPEEDEVLEESRAGDTVRLEHIWDFNLPENARRWLVVSAHGICSSNQGDGFLFSYADSPGGPYTPAFTVACTPSDKVHFVELPVQMNGKVYVKAETTNRSPEAPQILRKLSIDAMAITFQTKIGPYAQGDNRVRWEALVDDNSVPIVLYRPMSATTDMAIYGGSHVGILGGIIGTTNVPKILRLDLLRTDYYHDKAYPTYLYFNPYDKAKTVEVDAEAGAEDLYDTVSGSFVARNITRGGTVTIPPDTAMVLVHTPAKGRLTLEKGKTLINGVVVDYGGAVRTGR